MAFFNSQISALTMSHVVYTNDHMRSSAHRGIFNQFFLDRDIIQTTILDTTTFSKYNLNPAPLIEGPLFAGKFSTFVDGHMIFVTPQLLSQVLNLPSLGNRLFSTDDFRYFNFDSRAAIGKWTGDMFTDCDATSVLNLPDNLKVFHFFLTRILLPRSISCDIVTPLDSWIIHCATMGIPVNFCCLMFGIMTCYGEPEFEGSLPFGGLISSLLLRVGFLSVGAIPKRLLLSISVPNMFSARLAGQNVFPYLLMAQGEIFATTAQEWMQTW
ncbi:hypothetical protein LINPERHAP2_LOCUS216 [Linum perenne]